MSWAAHVGRDVSRHAKRGAIHTCSNGRGVDAGPAGCGVECRRDDAGARRRFAHHLHVGGYVADVAPRPSAHRGIDRPLSLHRKCRNLGREVDDQHGSHDDVAGRGVERQARCGPDLHGERGRLPHRHRPGHRPARVVRRLRLLYAFLSSGARRVRVGGPDVHQPSVQARRRDGCRRVFCSAPPQPRRQPRVRHAVWGQADGLHRHRGRRHRQRAPGGRRRRNVHDRLLGDPRTGRRDRRRVGRHQLRRRRHRERCRRVRHRGPGQRRLRHRRDHRQDRLALHDAEPASRQLRRRSWSDHLEAGRQRRRRRDGVRDQQGRLPRRPRSDHRGPALDHRPGPSRQHLHPCARRQRTALRHEQRNGVVPSTRLPGR